MYERIFAWLPGALMQAARLVYEVPYWLHQFSTLPTTFLFQGRLYPYFYHPYNATWRNERAVELPIIFAAMQESKGGQILEVGNVLSHYHRSSHTVVDKYERGRQIIAKDILEFTPPMRYDLIVSVSTLEHIGWDESPKEPGKHRRIAAHLRNLLACNGRIVVTVPVGYNSDLDRDLDARCLGFDEYYYLRRTARETWIESSWDEIKGARFGAPFPKANALAICMIKN